MYTRKAGHFLPVSVEIFLNPEFEIAYRKNDGELYDVRPVLFQKSEREETE